MRPQALSGQVDLVDLERPEQDLLHAPLPSDNHSSMPCSSRCRVALLMPVARVPARANAEMSPSDIRQTLRAISYWSVTERENHSESSAFRVTGTPAARSSGAGCAAMLATTPSA